MTAVLSPAADGIDSVPEVYDARALPVFKAPTSAGTVYHREIPEGVAAWLEGLAAEHLPRGRVILPPQAVPDAVQHLCDMVDMPMGPQRRWLQDDITGLADLFSDLMAAPFLRLRLDVVTTNACRKFHVDSIVSRLICTYRGTGTQYGFLQQGTDPQDISTVPPGSPFLLRGTLWPETPQTGLRHRSPPIEGTGETRLLLVLDPIFDPADEV